MNKEQLEAKAEAILKREGLGNSKIHSAKGTYSVIDAMCEMYTAALSGIDLDQVVYVPVSVEDELPPLGEVISISMNDGKTFSYEALGKGWAANECGYTHWLKKTTIRQLTSK
jgi:hypothetical protein